MDSKMKITERKRMRRTEREREERSKKVDNYTQNSIRRSKLSSGSKIHEIALKTIK